MNELPIIILQPQGPLFFGSTEPLINTYISSPKHEILIIDMNHVTMIDLSGAYILEDIINNCETKNIKVIVSNIKPPIMKILEKINFINNIGKNRYKNSPESVIPVILKHFKFE